MKQQRNPNLRFGGIIFTRNNPKLRGQLRRQMTADVATAYGENCILGYVRQDVALTEAQA